MGSVEELFAVLLEEVQRPRFQFFPQRGTGKTEEEFRRMNAYLRRSSKTKTNVKSDLKLRIINQEKQKFEITQNIYKYMMDDNLKSMNI